MAQNIKQNLIDAAVQIGVSKIGFAPVDRWQSPVGTGAIASPDKILAGAKTVIVLGAPVWLPLIEPSPSVLGREQIFVTDKLLEEAAYQLVIRIGESGGKAVSVAKYLPKTSGRGAKPSPLFSNEYAGYYAGLGTIGWNHRLLTGEWGPRIQLKSIITDLALEGDPLITKNLCVNCKNCKRICPIQALEENPKERQYAAYDAEGCIKQCGKFEENFCDPCGFCKKVCPVGGDRQLFKSEDTDVYFREAEVLSSNPDASQYRSWVHIRKFGTPPVKAEA